MKYEESIRVFLPMSTYKRLLLWANYYGFSLSKAARVIIDSAPLSIPEELCNEDEESFVNDQLQQR